MDNINNGIQISGGTFNSENLVVGNHGKAVKKNSLPAVDEGVEKVVRPVKQTGSPALDGQVEKVTGPDMSSRTRVFVAYSHKDTKWLERLRVHFKPLEQRGTIELWDDSKIAVGTKWKEELEAAIQSCSIALLIVSADFLATNFLVKYEFPKLLAHAEAEGATIIPLVVSPCLLEGSGIEEFQAANPPNKPLSEMAHSVREATLAKLVEAVNRRLA